MSQTQPAAEESDKATSAAKLFVLPGERRPRPTTVRIRVSSSGPAVLKFTVTAA